MPKYIEKAEEVFLPVLPLKGTVAFPSLPINLEVTRDISQNAFLAAVKNDNRVILVAQKDVALQNPIAKDLYKTGTLCVIKHVTKTPDNTYSVVFEGVCRAKISSFEFTDGFFSANAVCKKV
jgi:ATP-dependent Lon protease